MEWEYTGFIWNANVTLAELSIHRDIGGFCLRCVQAMYDGESDLLFSELAPDLATAKRRAAELYAELLMQELAIVETPGDVAGA